MKCPNCQKEIPDNSTFCSYCGAKIKPTPETKPSLLKWILIGIVGVCMLIIVVKLASGKSEKVPREATSEVDSPASETQEAVEVDPNPDDSEEDLELSGECGETLTWVKSGNGTVTISGTGDMWDYDSEGSNRSPWAGDRSIRKVIVKEGVRSVGKNAFSGCTEMEEVELPIRGLQFLDDDQRGGGEYGIYIRKGRLV